MKPSRLDIIEGLKERVAEAHASGCTQGEIAEIAGVKDRGTIAEWLKRSDVQALVSKFVEARANKILRHTDSKIEKLLESSKKFGMGDLLKIRREFAGQQITLDLGGDKAGSMEELLQRFHEDSGLAAKAKASLTDDSSAET